VLIVPPPGLLTIPTDDMAKYPRAIPMMTAMSVAKTTVLFMISS
jgi:hypothetical protein